MQKVVIIGNCQAGALEIMLKTNDTFTDRFEFVSFSPVHEIPDDVIPKLHQAVADADVVIPQRVEESYRNGIGLGTETLAAIAGTAEVVRWPSVYWAGYFPDLFYLRNAAGEPVVDCAFDYHDRLILQAYADGLDADEVCRLVEDSGRPSNAEVWAKNATAELGLRGKDCEVQVTSFIESRFRDELLFFTMNHPANVLLGFIAQQITDILGIPERIDHRRLPDEVLGPTFFPLHANHVRALELKFGSEFGAGHIPFRSHWITYEPREAVQIFFDYYARHPQLVELNLDSQAA
jgi:hypothetical protein